MRGYLLDTNVISEYSRVRPPDTSVRNWVDTQDEDDLHLSVLTLGEIRKGVTLLPVRDFNVWGIPVVNPWEIA